MDTDKMIGSGGSLLSAACSRSRIVARGLCAPPPQMHPCSSGSIRGWKNLSQPVRHIAAGHDGIAQRNAIAIVTSEQQARRFDFDVAHQIAEASVADIVLRNGLGIKNT